MLGLTGTDNLFDLNKGNINLLGKFSHGLIRVLVGEGVDINLDPCERKDKQSRGKGKEEMLECYESHYKKIFLT